MRDWTVLLVGGPAAGQLREVAPYGRVQVWTQTSVEEFARLQKGPAEPGDLATDRMYYTEAPFPPLRVGDNEEFRIYVPEDWKVEEVFAELARHYRPISTHR